MAISPYFLIFNPCFPAQLGASTSPSGSPKNLAKGEYGSKSAWADVDSRAAAPPTVRQQYERISELLVTMGAEEVFPDAVALLRWRDRNQRMLPKLALDGIATRDSCEQLIHCLQSGGGATCAFGWVLVGSLSR